MHEHDAWYQEKQQKALRFAVPVFSSAIPVFHPVIPLEGAWALT